VLASSLIVSLLDCGAGVRYPYTYSPYSRRGLIGHPALIPQVSAG